MQKTGTSVASRLLAGKALSILSIALLVLVSLLLTFSNKHQAEAATSSTLNFQARLLNASGSIVPDGYYNIEFNLYSVSSGGSTLWTETWYDSNGVTAGNDNRIQVRSGYVSVYLGNQTSFPTNINWDQELWLTMNVGGTTQTATPSWDGEMSPRLKLTAVPYAFKAGQLAKLTGAFTSTLDFAAQSASRSLLLPDESGTLCIQSSSNCGFNTDTSITLQDAYNATSGNSITTTDARNITFSLADTATDADFIIDILGTGNTFEVRDGGNDVLSVVDGGGITLQNTVDSTSGFAVYDADGGTPILNVDTTNERIGVGVAAPTVVLDVAGSPIDASYGSILKVAGTATSTTNYQVGSYSQLTVTPGGASTQSYIGSVGESVTTSTNLGGGAIAGALGRAINNGTGTIGVVIGVSGAIENNSSGVITNAYTLQANNPVRPSGTITNNYGLYVNDQTSGTNDYGIAIQGADTQALWIGSGADNTDAANGIAFGLSSDTNLYRSAADTLRTDDALEVLGAGITVAAAEGLDTNAAGALEIGKLNATSLDLCNSAACDTVNIGNLATVDADTINIGDTTDTVVLLGQTITYNNGYTSFKTTASDRGILLQSDGQTTGVTGGGLQLVGGGFGDDADAACINVGATSDCGTVTARSATAATIDSNNGAWVFTTDSGLTAGNTFTPTQRFRIGSNGSGNIAIGTDTTPDYFLDVDLAAGNQVVLTASAAPTADLLTVTNSGQGTSTAFVDGFQIDFLQATAATSTNRGLMLSATTTATDPASVLEGGRVELNNSSTAGTQYGFRVRNNDTAANSITEALLYIGNEETTASTVTDGIRIVSPGVNNGIDDAIDVSDSNIDNAINVGANDIVGTTAVIDFTNFDVDGSGNITTGGTTQTFSGASGTITTSTAGAGLTVSTAAGSGASVGGTLTLQAGAGGVSSGAGGAVVIQSGAAGGGNANGGNITLTAGAGAGTGVSGLVVIGTASYQTASVQNFTGSGAITQANIDSNSAVLISSDAAGYTATLGDPTITTAGKVIYVTNSGLYDMTLSVNGGGAGNTVTLKPNTTATMIWNGNDWTAAGASSSTDLQAAYNNTATSAGGAELVLNAPGGSADGLTIRNNATTPIVGGILEVQTSIGSNLLSVNNNASEYAANGGAESSTFTMWTSTPDGGTISRYTTPGDYVATGQASTSVVTAATANQGVRNTLSATLTPNLDYHVSFAVRGTANFATLDVVYSRDGTDTSTTSCATGKTVTTGQWTRVTCNFAAPSSGVTSSNAIFIRQSDATARTFYVDNLSVNVGADVNHAADGSVDSALGTNWTNFGTLDSLTRDTSTIYDTSGSVNVNTPNNADRGVRNNLSITPSVSTQYLVTFYAKSSNTFNDIRVRYSRDGGTDFETCVDYSTQSVSTTTWTEITCTFTTDNTTATDPDLIIDQTTGSDRNFYIDALSITLNTNTASNVQIGGANKGGPTTLFTLDRGSSAPIADNNDAYLGSMYYDTTTGRIQCYEADGWGACGAAPDNYVNLNPEYAGAVLNGSGVGTMTADFCANQAGVLQVNYSASTDPCYTSGDVRNYYKWTSPQATEQTYSIYVTYQLPATFKGFASDDTVQLAGRADSTSNAAVTYQMYAKQSSGGSLTQCGTGETTVVTTANTWQSVGINGNESTGCSLSSTYANGFVIFKINMKANSNASAYVSTLSFTTNGQ